MSTSSLGGVPLSSSIFLTMSRPAVTLPKTTWRPSSQLVLTVQMKNWLPLVSGPALRMGSGEGRGTVRRGSGGGSEEGVSMESKGGGGLASVACRLRPFNGECAGRGGDEAAP